MKKRYLINLFLLSLVGVLFWFTQYEPAKSIDTPRLSSISALDINNIKITRQNSDNIDLVKTEGQWQLTYPYSARANNTRIDLMLSILSANPRNQFKPMTVEALAQFGLAHPSAFLQLNEQTFAFGNVETLTQQRYVLFEHNVYLLDDNILPLLKANAGSFVDNRLIAKDQQIKQLTLPQRQADKLKFDLPLTITNNNGHWQSDSASLGTDQLVELVANWKQAYAMQVQHLSDEQLSGLGEPQLTMELQNGEIIPVHIQLSEQNLILSVSSTALSYVFPASITRQLFPAVAP